MERRNYIVCGLLRDYTVEGAGGGKSPELSVDVMSFVSNSVEVVKSSRIENIVHVILAMREDVAETAARINIRITSA